MLRDVQSYIERHGIVSVSDLSLHFHTDSQTLQPMLNKLRRKGRIRRLPMPENCAGCTCCPHTHLEIYQWVDQETAGSLEPGSLTPCEQRDGMKS